MPKTASKIGIMTKILIAFLGRFLISFGLLGYIAFNNIKGVGDYTLQRNTSLGGSAVNDSAEALENQAEEYLLRLAKDQADISNTVLEKVEAEVNVMAKFASALWSNPPPPGYRHLYSQEEELDDIYATSVYVLAPGIAVDAVRDELNLPINLLLSDSTELAAIAENMAVGNTGIAKCCFEDGQKYIAYASITCTNWSVGIVMPVEEIIAPALTTKSKIISATQNTGEHISS
nr:hypothetical protein BSM_14430 [uncultured archaeon]CBH39937.1 hypothetical protein BSM_34160 [uncultured archaeon]